MSKNNASSVTIKADDGKTDMDYYSLPKSPFSVHGVFFSEKDGRFLRMPSAVAKSISENVFSLNTNTAGGRVKFSTDATEICLSVTFDKYEYIPHFSRLGTSGFTLLEETENGLEFVYSFIAGHFDNIDETLTENGYSIKTFLKGEKMRNYVLFMPTFNDVKSLVIGLNKGAKVKKGKDYKNILPILYYGSSVTQGACANRADLNYPALISKLNSVDYVNLGFSGSAFGEREMAEYLSTVKCSLFVCDYDYNSPNKEHLENTHFNLYKTFREKNPNTPILFVSCIGTYRKSKEIDERKKVIKNTYNTAKKLGDENVYYLDGTTLVKNNTANFTVDGLHPNDFGFYLMAKGIYKKISQIDEQFK